jgi:hypothetical protein
MNLMIAEIKYTQEIYIKGTNYTNRREIHLKRKTGIVFLVLTSLGIICAVIGFYIYSHKLYLRSINPMTHKYVTKKIKKDFGITNI